jgi:hypothetical protein
VSRLTRPSLAPYSATHRPQNEQYFREQRNELLRRTEFVTIAPMPPVPAVLASSEPAVQELYRALLLFCHDLGPYSIEEKRTSVHLVRKSAFAGVHPRRKHLVFTVKSASAIDNGRIFKSEQVSKSRWHHEIKLIDRTDLNPELLEWLRDGYNISA